jgi:putative ABC transport system permease protein
MPFDSWLSDLRHACRDAIRRPGFTLLVSLTLALGLGVNAAVFALVDAVLVRPLPYRDPSRLVFVWQTLPQHNVFEVEAAPFDYFAWHSLRSLSELAAVTYSSFTLTGGRAEPERVRGARVTASLLPMLGLSPAIGRGFAAAEDRDDVPAVAILSDGLWRRRYGADPSIVGRTIEIEAEPRTVVGVMPRGAALPGSVGDDHELWLPMRMSPAERALEVSHNYTIVARLADGVTLAQASAELDAFAGRMAVERPSHTNIGARLVPVSERTVRPVRPALLVAAASVALLLLVSTGNASTLLIARAANRRGDLAVRAALGATQARLLSLSLAESLVFTSLGGAAALLLGSWTLRGLIALFAPSLPRAVVVHIDVRAALLTAGLAVAIGALFGAVAAYRPTAGRLADTLRGTRSTAGASAARLRNALVVGQLALAVVLLSAAGLMLGSVAKLSRVSPGFAADHVLSFRLTLTGASYDAAPARAGFAARLVEQLASIPGVRSAGLASVVPFGGLRNANVIDIEGRPRRADETSIIIDQRTVSPSYISTMQIPLVGGRLLTDADDTRAEPITLINRTMARRYFSNEDPLNHRVRTTAGPGSGTWLRIVGVVDDVRHLGLSRDPVPEMYRPIAQNAVPTFTIVVRTAGEPAAMAPTARNVVRGLDPNLPLYDVLTMDERIAASSSQTRATMLLLTATALLASALAAVAIYGAIWYSVVQRTSEIGIRMALGASRWVVFRGVVASAIALAAAGAAIGAALAAAGGSLLPALLFDTRPTDPPTYAAVIASVLILAVVASLVPACRAMRVEPATALRAG